MEKRLTKRVHVINTCLDTFIAKGLDETSTRDLANALNLQNAAVYYYFKTKKELVSECCKEAISRLEGKMTSIMLDPNSSLDEIFDNMEKNLPTLAPTMKFVVSVILSKEYGSLAKPYLSDLEKRYDVYTDAMAKNFNVTKEEIKAPVYMAILAFNNFMIFGEERLFTPQIMLVKEALAKKIYK